jgi:RimJ/RimL family protein N-acetyltransferase
MLETERLFLLPWRAENPADDIEAFRPIATDPQVMRYITGGTPWPDERIQEFIERQAAGLARNGFCLWRLLRKQQPERLIGFCGLQPWRDRPGLEIGYHGVIEIGWWLAPDCWGKGFATEAARAALRFGFEKAGLEKIIAVTHKDNQASQRVARRIGLDFERAITLESLEIWVFSTSNEASPSPR